MAWDCKLPEPYTKWVFKAMEVFFIAKDYKIPRFQTTYHPDARLHLVCMSDAGEGYYSHVILLVTQLGSQNDPNFESKIIPLVTKSWVSPKCFNLPQTELFSLVLLILNGKNSLTVSVRLDCPCVLISSTLLLIVALLCYG